MGFHNNYLVFFKCFTGWPADTNNIKQLHPWARALDFSMGGRQPGVLDVHRHCLKTTTPSSSRGHGIPKRPAKPMWPLVSIDIQGTGTYRSWWLGIKVLQGITPTGFRKNVKWPFQPTRLVQCMLDMWTPGSLAKVKLRYLCSFLFFHESEFAPLRPLYYTVCRFYKLGCSDVPCHHLGLSKR